jgi:23S rRNA (uracil1939-C5)-methyltransferase
MENKSDAPKRDKAEKHTFEKAPKRAHKSGGRTSEFKPFWETEPAKTEASKSILKTDQSRPAARKPAPKAEKPGDAVPQAAEGSGKPARAERKPSVKPDQARMAGPRPAGRPEGTGARPAGRFEGSGPGSSARPQRSGPGSAARSEEHGLASAERPERTAHEHKAHARHDLPKGEHHTQNLHSGQALELQIASTTNEGFGVAMHDGKRVLVAGGLPGELLVARVTYVGRREAFANTLKCLKVSPDRQPAPACGLGRVCDGCGLMQMRYPAQLVWKKNLVTRELRKYPSLGETKVFETIGSPKELNYRNTAKLVVAGKFSDPVIGIYRRNTHDVMEIGNCSLHHPLINKVVQAAKAGIKKGKVQIYNPKSEMGLLRYLVVRVAEPGDQVMVVFVTSDQGYNEMHHLAKFIQQAVPEVSVVSQNINTSAGNVIFGHKDRFITKAQTLRAYVGNKSFMLSPHSFFQVNSGAANIIYEKVRELAALTGTERVIDVYCGIGGISLFLAPKAKEVVGIEFVEAAVADATENAQLNRASNCRFEAGDAVHLIDEIGEEGGADLIILNPPRKGCDEKVLHSVAAIKPARVIYVSCSPETLSRDLDIMSRLGYRTVEVHPVDMFPQTIHVEDVALLERIEE